MTLATSRLKVSRAAAFSLSLSLLAGASLAQENVTGDDRSMTAGRARVVDYWTGERRRQAAPRDLVIDPRGLGYLRRPDGSLQPHGHDFAAAATAPAVTPQARPPSGSDSTGPTIGDMQPAAGDTIGASATFTASVSDASGVRSVSFVIRYPNGASQAFSASQVAPDAWSVMLQGFTDGAWSWSVEARDNARKGGNVTLSESVPFLVDTAGGGDSGGGTGGSDTVTNGVWSGGAVQAAAGRIYFEMPGNSMRKRWIAYVCSGTVVADGVSGRSVVLTAAHCVYDDVNKAFARNVLFIPNQAGTTGAGTDTNCSNDPLGCWVPTFGVVDDDWTARTFPDNIPWDYGYFVVQDSGAHDGAGPEEALEIAVGAPLTIDFTEPHHDDQAAGASSPDFTHALGYSYSEDPKFMFCAEDMTAEGTANWWLPSCGLSGGASGGPWVQPMTSGAGPVISVNSWGYSGQPGMAGPRLDVSSARCLLDSAELTAWAEISGQDGDAGKAVAGCD